jgi:hypothetical protein
MNSSPQVGLRWAIKRSFLEYIGRAPGGRGTLSDDAVVTEATEVVFTPDLGNPPPPAQEGTVLAFRGAVTFSAHFGMLLVRIANPWVTIQGTHGELTVLDPFQREGDARLRLATFEIDGHAIADGFERWTAADVRLAPEGCTLFNDVYPAAEPLEPLTIIVPAAALRIDNTGK